MHIQKEIRFIRILLILSFGFINAQSLEEINELRKAYEEKERANQASEIINQGIKGEQDKDSTPVKLLIQSREILEYYQERMKVIQKDLDNLNRLLIRTDSVPPLEYFGYKYFSIRDSIQFIDNTNIDSKYILGYGDEVIISTWGQAEQSERLNLERDGTVFVKNVGLLYLGGKTQEQAKSYLKDRFSKVYSTLNSDPPLTFLEFSIGQVKDININVSGHVPYPGNYVVNPSISIFNILVLSGGVSKTGTLRNIKIQRNGSFIDSLDIYPMITGTGITKSIKLLDNDIVVVPSRGQVVSITGQVLIPAYFEIKKNETIDNLLKFAGGINRYGKEQALVSRIDAPNQFIMKSKFYNTFLVNGDSLIIPKRSINSEFISSTINDKPVFKIPWFDNLTFETTLRILDIVENDLNNVELVRLSENEKVKKIIDINFLEDKNYELLPNDHISIHLKNNNLDSKFITVKGEVKNPGTYSLINYKENLNSILLRAGGLLKTSQIRNVIVKRDSMSFGSKTGELILSPGDTVVARPFFGVVNINGAVHNPGNIAWNNDNNAKDYINFAGGLTAYGDKKHIVLITPYGEASKITYRSNVKVLPGSSIFVSEKPFSDQKISQDRFQQISSVISSLVTLAILARTL